jgi:hypothetical protein
MMDDRDLANSRRPEWEEQYRRIGCKNLGFNGVLENGKDRAFGVNPLEYGAAYRNRTDT